MKYVISGPSCVGKSYVINKLQDEHDFFVPKPSTTRKKRENEMEGRDYFFREKRELRKETNDLQDGYWVVQLGGEIYGYTRESIQEFFKHENAILHIESSLALRLKRDFPEVNLIFFDYEDFDNTFFMRMQLRLAASDGQMSEVEYKRRLAYSQKERRSAYLFDVVFCSDDPEMLLYKILTYSLVNTQHNGSSISEETVYKMTWQHFTTHAGQRIQYINFYTVFIAALFTLVIACIEKGLFLEGGFAAIFIVVLTIVFWQLDSRNRDLVKHSEHVLKIFEDRFTFSKNENYLQKIKLISNDSKTKRSFILTHTKVFHILFIIVVLSSILIAGYCFSQYDETCSANGFTDSPATEILEPIETQSSIDGELVLNDYTKSE